MPFTIAQLIEYEEEIKKSRFQTFAVPVANEQQVKEFLQLKKDTTTTHQCWAWKIGHDVRFNDDGEPTGTAGRPILASIEGNDLTNVLVLVNRWFGGVKLGTGGLVRAYGGCAGKCLQLAEKIELIKTISAFFQCDFSEWAIFQYELQHYKVEYQEHYTENGVDIQLNLLENQIDYFKQKIQDITRGRQQLIILDT
ncbi:YigZ family protein [Moraxella sp. ZY210820]|uniref:IMPACT family protein n=1 Tax=unclassified Moraxella TaxID=2685852 RepID=UPI00272F3AC4|nr:YigZ family protein [Moraxella sp. ZY210820]WLF83311.1 IMPACT family protein [Moraxella sp. ZY210820]